jgi:hypothetical protein
MARLGTQQSAWFTNPETGEKIEGKILDQVWATEPADFEPRAPENAGWRQGAFVAQLIEWPGTERRVRFTYWLRKEGSGPNEWHFGGQYSASMGLEEFHALLGKLQARNW